MATIFLICLIVGGGLLAVAMFAGDADAHADLDLHVDFDGDFDTHVDGGDHDSFKFLSLRVLSYSMFGAGAAGTAMVYLSDSSMLVATVVALVVGMALAVVVDGAFRYLKRTESGATVSETTYVGLSAHVTVPFRPGQSGKVLLSRGSRTVELVARPYDPEAAGVEEWTDVLIVSMDQGQALVAPAGPGGLPTSD